MLFRKIRSKSVDTPLAGFAQTPSFCPFMGRRRLHELPTDETVSEIFHMQSTSAETMRRNRSEAKATFAALRVASIRAFKIGDALEIGTDQSGTMLLKSVLVFRRPF
jgi:hypothetical protein